MHWTCKNEFWSDRLEEWKVGCGWSADPYRDDNSRTEPILGAKVLNHRLAAVQEQLKEARAKTAAAAAARARKMPKVDSESSSEDGEGEGEEELQQQQQIVLPLKPVAKRIEKKIIVKPVRPPKSMSEAGASNSDSSSSSEGSDSETTQPGATTTAPVIGRNAVDMQKRRRGRPPGSVNKPKPRLLPGGMPTGMAPMMPPGVHLVQAMPMQPGAAGVVDMNNNGARPPQQAYMAQGQMKAPMAFTNGMPGMPTLMPTIMQYHPGMAQSGGTQMFAHPAMMMAGARPPQMMTPIQQQMQQASVQPKPGAPGKPPQPIADVLKASLVPYVERISTNVPVQYQKTIKNIINTFNGDNSHPLQIVQAYNELRQLFAAFPHIVQEMDSMVQTHPMLSMFFMQTATPQIIFYHDPRGAQGAMPMPMYAAAPQQQGGVPGSGAPMQFVQMPAAQLQPAQARRS